MKFRLRAGEWIDVLSASELTKIADATLARVEQLRRERAPRWIEADASGVTDASGNLTLQNIYRVPQGMELRIGRILLEVDGYSAGTPFQGGGVQLLRDGKLKTFQGGPLPAVISIPEGAQPRARNAAQLDVAVESGPANTACTATIEGTLHRRVP